MDRVMNMWRKNPGLVVILLVVLAVLSGQLPALRDPVSEVAEAQPRTATDEQIAITMRDDECGSKRKFEPIISCGRGQ